jgi:hypothetical protein
MDVITVDVIEITIAIAFCFGCALFAFYVVYSTRWVIQNAIEIGIALGFLLGIYLAVTSADSFATGAPVVALLMLACASIGCLLRCAFFVSGLIEENAPWAAFRDYWQPRSAYLHIIGARNYTNIAIVRAKNAEEGLTRLQRGCPRRLRVLASFAFDNERQAIAAEKAVRRELHALRNRGEWHVTDLETVLTAVHALPGIGSADKSKVLGLAHHLPSAQGHDTSGHDTSGHDTSGHDTSGRKVAALNARSDPR